MGARDGALKFKFTPYQAGLTKVLGPLESEIMQVVWMLGRATVAEVHKELQSRQPVRREIAYTTVMTTMSRLAEKNVLHREKPPGQVSFVYAPALGQEEFANMVVKNVLDSLITEYSDPVFRYFVAYAAEANPEQRATLARVIAGEPD